MPIIIRSTIIAIINDNKKYTKVIKEQDQGGTMSAEEFEKARNTLNKQMRIDFSLLPVNFKLGLTNPSW